MAARKATTKKKAATTKKKAATTKKKAATTKKKAGTKRTTGIDNAYKAVTVRRTEYIKAIAELIRLTDKIGVSSSRVIAEERFTLLKELDRKLGFFGEKV